MAARTDPLVLIVDGNNLLHYLHHLAPGYQTSTPDARRAAAQLAQYARRVKPRVTVELCLDHLPPDQFLLTDSGVRVFAARAPETADDLLLQRFRFHHHASSGGVLGVSGGQDCLVITNDGEVRDRVRAEGGRYLLVYDFVRRPGEPPVFRDPADFPAFIHQQRHSLNTPERTWPLEIAQTQPPRPEPGGEPAPAQPGEARLKPAEQPTAPARQPVAFESTPEPPICGPFYRLTMDKWPLSAGLRFLIDSFCAEHGKEYREIYQSIARAEPRPADLRELAAELLARCGGEPGFARRGSLMRRVRLALLLANGGAVALSTLAEQTGLPIHGLQGRIKEKADPWLEILP